MGVKYVKDFGFDSGFGFSGSAGKTSVRPHMRSPALAGAMVEKTTPGMGGKASETKKLASYNKPHMASKKGPSVPTYAKGGSVKGKKEMPAFLKGKIMKKADGGMISGGPMSQEERDNLRIQGDSASRAADLASRLSDMTREGMGESRGNPDMEVGISPIERPAAPMVRPAPRGKIANLRRRAAEMVARRAAEQAERRSPLNMIKPRVPVAPPARPVAPSPRYSTEPSMRRNPATELSPGMYAKGGSVKGKAKVGKVMGEFKRGELHSGSKKGPVVTNPKQAVAIALSEARGAGARIPKKGR